MRKREMHKTICYTYKWHYQDMFLPIRKKTQLSILLNLNTITEYMHAVYTAKYNWALAT